MGQPGFWDNQERAQATVAELKALSALVKPMTAMISSCDDAAAMLEMGDEDPEIASELPHELDGLETRLADLELKSLLDGPHDANTAILSINARDAGVDPNDWAEMR